MAAARFGITVVGAVGTVAGVGVGLALALNVGVAVVVVVVVAVGIAAKERAEMSPADVLALRVHIICLLRSQK